MKKEELLSNTAKDIENIINAVNSELLPESNDIMQVVGGLLHIKELTAADVKVESLGDVEIDINKLFVDYNHYAEESSSLLKEMLDEISCGKVPSRETHEEFNISIDLLRDMNERIYNAAQGLLSGEELPAEGSSVNAYWEAVKSSKTVQIQKQLRIIQDTLNKFIAVRSLVSAYSEALVPFQAKAAEIMSLISIDPNPKIDQLQKESEGPAIFLEALECQDLDSDDGLSLLEKIGANYPKHVEFGLSRQKYYIDESVTSIGTKFSVEKNKLLAGAANKTDDVSKQTTFVTPEQNNDQFGSIAGSDEVEEKVESDFSLAISNSGLLEYSSDSLGEISWEYLPSAESKKISSSIFMSEIRKCADMTASKKFIQEIVKKDYISKDFITTVLQIPENVFEGTIDYLYRRGYIRKYTLNPGGSFFCKSKRLEKALSYKEASKFIDVRQQRQGDTGEKIDDKATSASARLTYCNLITILADYIFSSNCKKYFETKTFFTEAFIDYIAIEDNTNLLVICIFWDNISECDDFLEKLRSLAENHEAFQNVIFATNTADRAGKCASVFLENSGLNFANANINLYSLNDNQFFSYKGDKQIYIEDVLPIIKEDVEVTRIVDGEQTHIYQQDYSDIGITKSEHEVIQEQMHQTTGGKNYKLLQNDTVNNSTSEAISEEAVITKKDSEGTETSDKLLGGLISGSIKPTEMLLDSIVGDLISGKLNQRGKVSNVMNSAILSKAISTYYRENSDLEKKANALLLATRNPLWSINYSSDVINSALVDNENECLVLANYLQALLCPNKAFDYGLKQQADYYLGNFELKFPSLKSVKALLSKMASIRDVIPGGFSESIMSLLGNAKENQKYTQSLQKQATDLLTLPNIKTRIKALPAMYNACFGNGSELYDCMLSISQNKVSECDFVREVLLQFSDEINGEIVISITRTEEALDEAWDKVKLKGHYVLSFDARPQALKQFYSRLELMKVWIVHTEQQRGGKLDIKRINVLRKEIITLASKAKADVDNMEILYAPVLYYALDYIEKYLTEFVAIKSIFSEFICSGVFSLDDSGVPIIDDTLNAVKYYEPWRNMLKHIVYDVNSLEVIRSNIVEVPSSPVFDNLHQLKLLGRLEKGSDNLIGDQLIKEAKLSADDRTTKFRENLELAYTYNRISEPEKEKLAGIMEHYKDDFYASLDFGCWGCFLTALEQEINEFAEEKRILLRKEILARKGTLAGDETSTILNEAEMLLEKDMNFAVAEEYFNRFDNGEREFSDDLYAIMHEKDSFAEFISDEVFLPLQQECHRHTGKTVKSFSWGYLDSKVPKDWSTRQREDSRKLVENWPIRRDQTQESSIKTLLTGLGFLVKGVTKGNGKKEEFFNVNIEPVAKSMSDYRHPISVMGTQIQSPLKVVVLYGNYAPQQLVDTISSLDFGGMTIVLIDRSIDRMARRQIGEIFHTKTSGQNPFLLIDQILLLYLAKHQVTERLPVMLKCTLPYTSYQPFIRDGGSTTDEMFFGRTRELATILDLNGACVVYGGRQLGKTALLQRAESRKFNPENSDYAIYINIINCHTEKELVEKICEVVSRKTGLPMTKAENISQLCQQFDNYFRRGKVKTMLLLLDEADNFLSFISSEKYKPLQSFIDLRRETTNKFKFVLAGLHNVCRAKNATIDNGVFGQLGTPLCVKPLSPTDALQLLSRPLKYLGFEIDRYPHLETILTNTNYYPGILQFFGYMLVETFMAQYGKYYGAADGNPPFTLQDEQLGAVMNSADLNRSIKDKFRWSLELDPRYFMLARCIAVLYYLRNENLDNWLGFSVDELSDIADIYQIHCLEGASKMDYINLLDEMYEMGILSKPANELYKLRRNSFVNMIGTDFDSLDAEIKVKNEESGNG